MARSEAQSEIHVEVAAGTSIALAMADGLEAGAHLDGLGGAAQDRGSRGLRCVVVDAEVVGFEEVSAALPGGAGGRLGGNGAEDAEVVAGRLSE